MTKEERKIAEGLIKCVPTTWLDPLLSGESRVIDASGNYNVDDIERLLTAIRKNMEKVVGI